MLIAKEIFYSLISAPQEILRRFEFVDQEELDPRERFFGWIIYGRYEVDGRGTNKEHCQGVRRWFLPLEIS